MHSRHTTAQPENPSTQGFSPEPGADRCVDARIAIERTVVSFDSQLARCLVLVVLQQGIESWLNVTELDPPPGPIYAIDPEQWMVFSVTGNECRHVGGTECVAVHRETGEVRFVGRVGEEAQRVNDFLAGELDETEADRMLGRPQ